MAIIKLTDEQWLDQEAARVEGAIRQWLGGSDGRAGRDTAELVDRLRYVGLRYTTPEIAAIRDKLIADGVIEVM